MKKFLTLKNILLCSAALLALVAFILSFTAGVKYVDANGNGEKFFNFIWGPKRLAEFGGGAYIEANIPAQYLPMPVATLPLVGALLVFVGAAAAVVLNFLLKKPFTKWIVLGCGAVVILGGVFFFLIRDGAVKQIAKVMEVTEVQAQEFLAHYGLKIKSAGAVVGGILGILAGAACVASTFVPEKK